MASSALLSVLKEYADEIFSPVPMKEEEGKALDKKKQRPEYAGRIRTVREMESAGKKEDIPEAEGAAPGRRRTTVDLGAMLVTMLILGIVLAGILGTTYGIQLSREQKLQASQAQEYRATSPTLRLFARSFPQSVTAEIWLRQHEDEFPADIVKKAKTNTELREFLYLYGTEQYSARGDALTPEELSGGIPMLFQWDERWGFLPYGNSVMGISGDAPTVLSMLVVGLIGNVNATPKAVLDVIEEEELLENGESTPDVITWGGMKYGVYCESIRPVEADVLYCLNLGYPVAMQLGPSVFSDSDHYVIIVGQEAGGYRIYDPLSRENSEKVWNFSEFNAAIKNIWWCMRGI